MLSKQKQSEAWSKGRAPLNRAVSYILMMSDPERVSRGNHPITVPVTEQKVHKNAKAPSGGMHWRPKTNKLEDSLDLLGSVLGKFKRKSWVAGVRGTFADSVPGVRRPPSYVLLEFKRLMGSKS